MKALRRRPGPRGWARGWRVCAIVIKSSRGVIMIIAPAALGWASGWSICLDSRLGFSRPAAVGP